MREGPRTAFATPPVRSIALHAALNNAGVQLLNVVLVIHLVLRPRRRQRRLRPGAGLRRRRRRPRHPRCAPAHPGLRVRPAMLGTSRSPSTRSGSCPSWTARARVVVASFALALGIASAGTASAAW
ncbi:hypothetical protein [Streptomyces sp. KL116D]|uniref:hypothetical protein n=1 Tax=Streptomyces sp. KL116D TaxID=3045152 RepID=UPI003555EDE6